MSFVPTRLRTGELAAGCTGAAVLVLLFAVTWYRAPGAALSGWQCYGALGWAILLSGALALCLVVAQAAFRAPAIAVTLDEIACVVTGITLVWLAVRVVLLAPDGFAGTAGPWLALAGQLGLFASSVVCLRQEGIREADGPGEIPVVSLEDSPS